MRAHRPPSAAPRAAAKAGPAARPASAPVNADQIDRLRDRERATAGAAGGAGPSLPSNTRELIESRTLQVRRVASYTGAQQLPPDLANKLMIGVRREGVSEAGTLAEVLDSYIDEGTVELLTISAGAGQGADTWLRFYCGDTEVGYIFRGDTLKAIVGDQDINPV
jgi:hypothetical protein